MQYRLGLVLAEDTVQQSGVIQIPLDEGDAVMRQSVAVAIDQIVEHDDGFAKAKQVLNGVGADVAGSAGDEKGGT
jgi:hypothetical protein